MNKWILFIISAVSTLLSTYAAMVMLQHYHISIEYKFEHWDNVAAVAIAEIIMTFIIFIIHFILHMIISLFLIYKIKSRRMPIKTFFRFTDSWKINILRISLILIIITALVFLIPYSFPAWSIAVTILMLIVYSFWILQLGWYMDPIQVKHG